jgi:hypothetical protein
MIDKEVIDKERMYAENQLKEKSGSNIVVEWMSVIKEIAENGYALSSANVHSKDEKFQRIIGMYNAVIMVLKEN